MFFGFPGWPGPVYFGGQTHIGGVSMPMLPAHPAGEVAGAVSPLTGLAAYGVPVAQTPTGRAFIQAGGAAGESGGIQLPPEIPGMPPMPGPPGELVMGGPHGGGLFQAVPPVMPFDPGRQVPQQQ